MTGFQPFGMDHVAALALLALSAWTIARRGPAWSEAVRRGVAWSLATLTAAYTATLYIRFGMAGWLSWDWALPLDLCYCVLFACFLGLIRTNALAMEAAYFWGMAATLQAALTPDVSEGFPSLEFILFFWSHGLVLLAIAFFIGCRGFRPRPGSVGRMMILTNLYAAAVGSIDALFGWNYGYLCRKPAQPSLLDWLGPWPWYLLSLEGVALASFWLLDLPWRRSRGVREAAGPEMTGGFRFRSDDGAELFVRRWPARGEERGVLHIAHGLAEHSARYGRVAAALNEGGWTVYAHDHRGHGGTAGSLDRMGFIASSGGWERAMEDLRLLSESERREHPGRPFVLMGHSMGSFMALHFAGRHGRLLDGCVLSGGGGRPDLRVRFLRALACAERLRLGRRGRSRLLHALALKTANRPFRPVRTAFDWLSRDGTEVDRYIADPFNGWVGSAQLWIDLITGAREAWRRDNLARIPRDLPIYVFAGTMDPVSDGCRQLEHLLELLEGLGMRHVSRRFYPGGRHEMLNETNRNEVTADLAAWLRHITGADRG